MLIALDVAAVMPSKIFMLFNQGHHRVNPQRGFKGIQSTLQRCLNVTESIPAPVQGITAITWRPFYFCELLASLANPGRQVIGWSWHLARLAQAACDLSCFFH